LRYIKTAVLAIAAVLLAGLLAQPAHAELSFDVAYSNLSRSGSWLVSSQYGHVWQPREYNRDWNPYYDGHWVYTDMGWTWVSDYEWGSIPYHYGTWVSDPDDGWVWVPGSVWAPSWVVFRTGPDYIGWAPVSPGFSVGIAMDMGGPSNFIFVSSRDFLAPRIRTSIIPRERTSVFINNTTVVNNIVVQNNVVINRGPDYQVVERATGRTIREERIENVARVAPYDHVSRAQLAVDPERMKRGLRVAEPVPASQPLPVPDKRENRAQNPPPTDPARPQDKRPAAQPNAQEQAPPPTAGRPGGAPDTRQGARRVQPPPGTDTTRADQRAKDQAIAEANAGQRVKDQANADANANQRVKDQANARANADQRAKDQATASANADQHAKDQANARANANQRGKDQANVRANADQRAKDQATANANADQRAKDQANAKANANQRGKDQANANANADQHAKDQANAKARADAKAKQQHKPDKNAPPEDKNAKPQETPQP